MLMLVQIVMPSGHTKLVFILYTIPPFFEAKMDRIPFAYSTVFNRFIDFLFKLYFTLNKSILAGGN